MAGNGSRTKRHWMGPLTGKWDSGRDEELSSRSCWPFPPRRGVARGGAAGDRDEDRRAAATGSGMRPGAALGREVCRRTGCHPHSVRAEYSGAARWFDKPRRLESAVRSDGDKEETQPRQPRRTPVAAIRGRFLRSLDQCFSRPTTGPTTGRRGPREGGDAGNPR